MVLARMVVGRWLIPSVMVLVAGAAGGVPPRPPPTTPPPPPPPRPPPVVAPPPPPTATGAGRRLLHRRTSLQSEFTAHALNFAWVSLAKSGYTSPQAVFVRQAATLPQHGLRQRNISLHTTLFAHAFWSMLAPSCTLKVA